METASQVLLIIVSATLAVFLILASVAAIFLLRTLKKVNDMTSKVENTAEAVRNTIAAVPIMNLAAKALKWSKNRRK